MRGKLDGRKQVKAEDTHYGLGVNRISSGYKVAVKLVTVGDVYKFLASGKK